MAKERYRLKIAPKNEPNADGRWIEVEVDGAKPWGWLQTEKFFKPHVPSDHFLVKVERKS